MLPEAIVAIGVLFESASPAPSLDDPAFGAILTKQAEDQVALNRIEGSSRSTEYTQRKSRRRQPQAPAAWNDGLSSVDLDKLIKEERNKIMAKMFHDLNDRSHFSQLSIRKWTNWLDLWILGQGGFPTGQAESPGSHDGFQSEMYSDEAESILHDQSSRDSTGSSFRQSATGASGGSQLAG